MIRARLLSAAFLACVACFASRAAPADEAKLVEPSSVRCLVSNGKHNAFTAMVRWRDTYWLAYREADSHDYGEADIVVLRSSDAQDWTEAFRVNILPDDRDPQFVATEKRLFLYDNPLQGGDLTAYVTYTDDGQTWSEPRPVYEPRFIMWKPIVHEGKFFAAVHRKTSDPQAREVHLITSDDGLDWRKISTVSSAKGESETTLYFNPDGRLTAFLRTKYSIPGHIFESTAPFTEWTQRPAGTHLSGHSLHVFRGVPYLFCRTMNDAGADQGTMIYTYENDQLKPYCRLPAGGDCSYPEAVELGDEMLVSYYSTHEGTANIYLARVPLR
jgi:hypothetical protein